MSAELFLIYARARNGTIGNDGGLPWHLPADLKHFKALTHNILKLKKSDLILHKMKLLEFKMVKLDCLVS